MINIVFFNLIGHFSEPCQVLHTPGLVKRNQKGRFIRKRCKQCYREGKRVETMILCSVCPDKPGLCFGRCFELFHALRGIYNINQQCEETIPLRKANLISVMGKEIN